MNLVEQFVRIGFGPPYRHSGFQSTHSLTRRLSAAQASQLVLDVPEYGSFQRRGGQRRDQALRRSDIGRRVRARKLSGAVLRSFLLDASAEGLFRGKGTRISDAENKQLVEKLRKVFVQRIGEFGPDQIDPRRIRIWWSQWPEADFETATYPTSRPLRLP